VLVCPTEIGIAGLRLVEEVLGVDEAVWFTQVRNVRSRAVMQHLGMSFVGEIRAPLNSLTTRKVSGTWS
jgi:RimJ/RimL family protein N-acetyltransferase